MYEYVPTIMCMIFGCKDDVNWGFNGHRYIAIGNKSGNGQAEINLAVRVGFFELGQKRSVVVRELGFMLPVVGDFGILGVAVPRLKSVLQMPAYHICGSDET